MLGSFKAFEIKMSPTHYTALRNKETQRQTNCTNYEMTALLDLMVSGLHAVDHSDFKPKGESVQQTVVISARGTKLGWRCDQRDFSAKLSN